jgi:hypothetical protein
MLAVVVVAHEVVVQTGLVVLVVVAMAQLLAIEMVVRQRLTLVVAVVALVKITKLFLAVMVVLVLLLFVTPIPTKMPYLQQEAQLSPILVVTKFIAGLVQEALRFKAQNESLCKSRKRHSHTSYCG